MSTPPVSVPITALDLTEPGFASAAANGQRFQQSMNANTYSMREAQSAARLFNDELGTHMSRHLTTIMSQSALLGPALEMALPIAAAVGFFEVIEKVGTALGKWYFHTEGMKQLQEQLDSSTKRVAAFYGDISKLNAETAGVGVSAQQKWATELEAATANVERQRKSLAQLSDTIWDLENGSRSAIGGNTVADLPTLKALKLESTLQLSKFTGEQAHAQAELNNAQSAGMKDYQKTIDGAIEKAQRLAKVWDEVALAVEKASHKYKPQERGSLGSMMGLEALPPEGTIPDWMSQLSSAQTSPLYSGSREAMNLVTLQTNQNAAIQAAQDIYEQTATKAQKYSDSIAGLTELLDQGRISQQQFSQAALTASADLDKRDLTKYYKELGRDISSTVEQAALFEGSWSKAFEKLLGDIARVILQMYVFDALSNKFGGTGGSFLGSLFAGMANSGGHASGGYIPPGQWGTVGESGPEPAFGGSTGLSILPHGSGAGITHVHNYDLRGADVGMEQRLLRLLPMVEERAVRRSVATVAEQSMRR